MLRQKSCYDGYLQSVWFFRSWLSIKCFKKFGFGENFIYWINMSLNNQQSRVTNGGFTTPYFNLEKFVRKDHPIPEYLFTFAFEVLFELIKHNAD